MNYQITKQDGFTLVETLVAIAVLMVAIAGPLSIANKALTSALYSRDQSIASNLAQESMEIIKNVRDNNIVNDADFLTNINFCTTDDGKCDIGMNLSSGAGAIENTNACTAGVGCSIYVDPTNGYSHSSTNGTQSIFSRYFYITSIIGDADDYQVTVVVKWNETNTSNELRLRSELVNASRQ